MFGPRILVDSMSEPSVESKDGRVWQYHSRSDRHSKVACWAILFDLLRSSSLLRDHVDAGRVMFGINHQMNDWSTGRRKDLDLVLCRPASGEPRRKPRTFASLADDYGLELDEDARRALDALPELREGPIGPVFLALEAKACMTAHVKALPRLYDELNSSHLTIHGDTEEAIAAGFVMVNRADEFISPARQTGAEQVNVHRQPDDTERVIQKILEIPRRVKRDASGFEAMAIVVVDMRNDGSPVRLVKEAPAPQEGEPYHYGSMIHRIAHLYESRRQRS